MNTTDIRSKIHQVVTAISPLDKAEQEHIRFVLDWIESSIEIFRIEKPVESGNSFGFLLCNHVARHGSDLVSGS